MHVNTIVTDRCEALYIDLVLNSTRVDLHSPLSIVQSSRQNISRVSREPGNHEGGSQLEEAAQVQRHRIVTNENQERLTIMHAAMHPEVPRGTND